MNPKDEHLTAEVYIDCKGRKSPKQCGMNTHIVVSDNNHGYIVAQESFIADNQLYKYLTILYNLAVICVSYCLRMQ